MTPPRIATIRRNGLALYWRCMTIWRCGPCLAPQPTATRKAMVKATKTLASDLLNGVRINPSESISVFSESAKMPITVSNDLPYAVSVQVNSLTDSMQIVTSRTADIDIPRIATLR